MATLSAAVIIIDNSMILHRVQNSFTCQITHGKPVRTAKLPTLLLHKGESQDLGNRSLSSEPELSSCGASQTFQFSFSWNFLIGSVVTISFCVDWACCFLTPAPSYFVCFWDDASPGHVTFLSLPPKQLGLEALVTMPIWNSVIISPGSSLIETAIRSSVWLVNTESAKIKTFRE